VFPYAFLYFVPFILIATYSMLNLFIAIVVSTMQALSDAEADANRTESPEHVAQMAELNRLHERMTGLEELLKSPPGRPELSVSHNHAYKPIASPHSPLVTPADALSPGANPPATP
jgi:hypothetical protein